MVVVIAVSEIHTSRERPAKIIQIGIESAEEGEAPNNPLPLGQRRAYGWAIIVAFWLAFSSTIIIHTTAAYNPAPALVVYQTIQSLAKQPQRGIVCQGDEHCIPLVLHT